jgi:hypothetical protein
MSWLIEEESLDRVVLDDIDVNTVRSVTDNVVLVNTVEHCTTEITPLPIDFVTVSNSDLLYTSVAVHNDDFDESIRSGMTIIPSCSESSSLSVHLPQYQQQEQDQQQRQLSIQNVNTTESIQQINESDVTLLSMHPNSIDSSLLTDLSNSMISSIVSDDHIVEYHIEDTNDNYVEHCDTQLEESTPSELSTTNDIRNSNTPSKFWYSRFETEKDWDDFQVKTKKVLEAIDCPIENHDDMITQLIHMEEYTFWESDCYNNSTNNNDETTLGAPSAISWLLEVVALSASIALSGVVIFKILKGR